MIKKLTRLFFFLCGIIFIFLSIIKIPTYRFNSLTLKENIGYLASDKIGGRICGSKENDIIANSISNKMNEIGLVPLDKDFKQGFQITVPYKNDSKASMQIKDSIKDEAIYDFVYGKDFKEDLLNFKESSVTLSKTDDFKVFKNAITFCKNGSLFLFYVTDQKDFSFRSSFLHKSNFAFNVAITKDTYKKLISEINANKNLYIQLPYSTKTTEVFNVAGKIEGKSPTKKPLILTAHFDHLGTDCLNNIYCGALDNASGSCFLLEVAKTFSSLKLKPERDIIFVFLNAEEFGLIGSEEFSKSHKNLIENSQVINIDMIGAPNTKLSLVRSEKDKEKQSLLTDSLKDLSNTSDMNVSYEDSSDHASFSKYNSDAVTLTNDDSSKIHTPDDKLEFISTGALDNGFNLVEKKIFSYCYSNLALFLQSDLLYLIFFFIILLYISVKNIRLIKNKHK